MPWINNTPHSLLDKTVVGGSGAKKLGLKLKAQAKAEKAAERERLKAEGIKPKPPVPPYQKALVRLKAGEAIIFTRPNLWTWERTGGKIAPGVIATLRSFKHLSEVSAGLFPDQPGQVWGWSGVDADAG